MDRLVEQILHSPKMEIYLEQLNEARRREQLERERFLDKFVDGEKAEFINGEKVVHSPSRASHNDCRAHLFDLMRNFVRINRCGKVGDEKWLVSLTRNDYEPDICYWGLAKSVNFRPDQMRFPAPDMIAEVLSPSTESIDRGVKFEDYAAHGVAEYWIVDPDKRVIEQYGLHDDGFEMLLKSSSGMIKSKVVEGFEIPIISVFDDAENLAFLRKLLS
jgi:Uma2 family endonuclease